MDACPVLADPCKAYHIINSVTFFAPPFSIIHIPVLPHHWNPKWASGYDEGDLLATAPLVPLHMLAHSVSRNVLFRFRDLLRVGSRRWDVPFWNRVRTCTHSQPIPTLRTNVAFQRPNHAWSLLHHNSRLRLPSIVLLYSPLECYTHAMYAGFRKHIYHLSRVLLPQMDFPTTYATWNLVAGCPSGLDRTACSCVSGLILSISLC